MKKTVGMALASLLAVLVLSGQALGHRSMLSLEDDIASAYDAFGDYREDIASVLGLNVDQIGTISVNTYPEGLINAIQILSESDSFAAGEVSRIKEVLSDDNDLGVLLDYTECEVTNASVLALIATPDDDGYYNDFAQFREQAASVLDLDFDQIGEVNLVAKPDTVVFTLELLPESGSSFNDRDFKRISDALSTGDLGPDYDLEYSSDTPGALNATIWTSENQENDYNGVRNYVNSQSADAIANEGMRKLLSEPFFFDDDDLYYYYYVEYDIYYYFD